MLSPPATQHSNQQRMTHALPPKPQPQQQQLLQQQQHIKHKHKHQQSNINHKHLKHHTPQSSQQNQVPNKNSAIKPTIVGQLLTSHRMPPTPEPTQVLNSGQTEKKRRKDSQQGQDHEIRSMDDQQNDTTNVDDIPHSNNNNNNNNNRKSNKKLKPSAPSSSKNNKSDKSHVVNNHQIPSVLSSSCLASKTLQKTQVISKTPKSSSTLPNQTQTQTVREASACTVRGCNSSFASLAQLHRHMKTAHWSDDSPLNIPVTSISRTTTNDSISSLSEIPPSIKTINSLGAVISSISKKDPSRYIHRSNLNSVLYSDSIARFSNPHFTAAESARVTRGYSFLKKSSSRSNRYMDKTDTTGPYTNRERASIALAIDTYLASHDIPKTDLPLLIKRRRPINKGINPIANPTSDTPETSTANPYNDKKYNDFFHVVASTSGINRNLDSVYHYMKITYAHNRDKFGQPFSHEEDMQIRDMVSLGMNWFDIGMVLGRTNISSRYQLIMQRDAGKTLGSWTQDEENLLLKALLKYTHPTQDRPSVDSWHAIAEYVGSRDRQQCYEKFRFSIQRDFLEERALFLQMQREKTGTGDHDNDNDGGGGDDDDHDAFISNWRERMEERREEMRWYRDNDMNMLKAMYESANVYDESEVNWHSLPGYTWGSHYQQYRWMALRRQVPEKLKKTFKETIKYIIDNYESLKNIKKPRPSTLSTFYVNEEWDEETEKIAQIGISTPYPEYISSDEDDMRKEEGCEMDDDSDDSD